MILISDLDKTYDINIDFNNLMVKEFRDLGNKFAIATGRSYEDFMNVNVKYNIKFDYLIYNHGSTIIDSSGVIIYNKYIDSNLVNLLLEDLDISNCVNYFLCSSSNSRASASEKYLNKIHITYDYLVDDKVKFILSKYSDVINCYKINDYALEIISCSTDKCKAIDYLVSILGDDFVYVIGDSYNDITMIKKYNGYCVENSIKEILEVGKVIGGVGELIDKLLINN